MEQHGNRKKQKERFWQHVEKLDGNRQKCLHCGKEITAESISRMISHWAGEAGKGGVSACENVPPELKRDAKADIERCESRKEDRSVRCEFCSATTSSELNLSYHKAGEKRRGVRPCKKISEDARRAALEEVTKLGAAAKGKRPRSYPDEAGPSHPLPLDQAYKRQSSQLHLSNQITPAALLGFGNPTVAHDFPSQQFGPGFFPSEQVEAAYEVLPSRSPNNDVHDGLGTSHPLITWDQTSYPLTTNPAHFQQYTQPNHTNQGAQTNVLSFNGPGTSYPLTTNPAHFQQYTQPNHTNEGAQTTVQSFDGPGTSYPLTTNPAHFPQGTQRSPTNRSAPTTVPPFDEARGTSHPLTTNPAHVQQSTQPNPRNGLDCWGTSHYLTTDLSDIQPCPQPNPRNEGVQTAIPPSEGPSSRAAHNDPAIGHHLPTSLTHSRQSSPHNPNNESTPSAVEASAMAAGRETHTMLIQNQNFENADTQGVSAIQNELDLPSQLSTPLSNTSQSHDGPSAHSTSSSAHGGLEVDTPTQASDDDTMTSPLILAIQKYLLFTRLPPSHLSTGEFRHLYDSIATHGSSNPSVLPLLAWNSKNTATKISEKVKREVDDYVKMVKGSWTSTKCTICIQDFTIPNEDLYVIAAIARSHVGTIFLRHEQVPLQRNRHQCQARASKSEAFLRSIIDDVGLNNISHISIPGHMSPVDGNHQTIMLVDVAYNLAKTYINIYYEASGLIFLEYAFFIASIFHGYFDNRSTSTTSADHLNLLSAMIERKEELHFQLTNVSCHFITGLTFWKSKDAYNDICERIDRMLQITNKDGDFVYTKYPDVLNQEERKQKVCNLIVDIIANNNILSISTFWESVEAYVSLYNHIHKMLYRVEAESFTLEDYFSAYIEAKCLIIRTEYFCEDDYKQITKKLDNLLPQGKYGHAIACCICPQIRNLESHLYKLEHVRPTLLKMMEGDDSDKEAQLTAYCQKNDVYIMKEAWLPTELMQHSKTWWQKWGNKVPHLKTLAINILNGLCSNNHNWRIIYDMYKSTSKEIQGKKLDDMLYMRLNHHLKYTAAKGQGQGLTLGDATMVFKLNDLHDLFRNRYFMNGVY